MTDGADRRTTSEAQADGEVNQWWLVVAVGLAVFMASMDMSIVNVALPAIERDFEVDTGMTEWTCSPICCPCLLGAVERPLAGQRRAAPCSGVIADRLRSREYRSGARA
jgi:MFS family permease